MLIGLEQIGFARRRRRAAHVHAGGRAGLDEHDGAAGRPLGQRVMADLDAGHRGQRRVRRPPLAMRRRAIADEQPPGGVIAVTADVEAS